MAILNRSRAKSRREKHKPEIVTGEFELHYEDVINRNRFALVALATTGLVLLAVLMPKGVYQSTADSEKVSIEAELGLIENPRLVERIKDDITASGNSYIEFKLDSIGN